MSSREPVEASGCGGNAAIASVKNLASGGQPANFYRPAASRRPGEPLPSDPHLPPPVAYGSFLFCPIRLLPARIRRAVPLRIRLVAPVRASRCRSLVSQKQVLRRFCRRRGNPVSPYGSFLHSLAGSEQSGESPLHSRVPLLFSRTAGPALNCRACRRNIRAWK